MNIAEKADGHWLFQNSRLAQLNIKTDNNADTKIDLFF